MPIAFAPFARRHHVHHRYRGCTCDPAVSTWHAGRNKTAVRARQRQPPWWPGLPTISAARPALSLTVVVTCSGGPDRCTRSGLAGLGFDVGEMPTHAASKRASDTGWISPEPARPMRQMSARVAGEWHVALKLLCPQYRCTKPNAVEMSSRVCHHDPGTAGVMAEAGIWQVGILSHSLQMNFDSGNVH
jgi:hypothetical protein